MNRWSCLLFATFSINFFVYFLKFIDGSDQTTHAGRIINTIAKGKIYTADFPQRAQGPIGIGD